MIEAPAWGARCGGEVARRFGLGPVADAVLIGPVAAGEQGEVWRLDVGPQAWAIKRLFAAPVEDEMLECARYQDAVVGAGLPAPTLVRDAHGEIVVDVEGALVRAYRWVDLCAPDPGIDAAAVGSVVGRIHQVEVAGGLPVHPWYTEPVGARRWDDLVSALEANGAPFASAWGELRPELVALEQLLSPPAAVRTCHRDLWADNLRTTPSGEICVIDWENAGLADPSQELAVLLYEFAYGDADRARALYEAYLDEGGPGRVDGPGSFSMVIAQLGHINEKACQRWLDAAGDGAIQAAQESRVAEFTARPITRRVIGDLLDSISGCARRPS